MIIRKSLVPVLIVIAAKAVLAVLYPVTGDSASVWNGIDLLPAEQSNVDLSAAEEKPLQYSPQPADSGHQTPTPKEERAASSPVQTEPFSGPEVADTSQQPKKAISKQAITSKEPGTKPPSGQKPRQKESRDSSFSQKYQNTAQTEPQADTISQPPDTTPAITAAGGTLIITSVPDSARIIINEVDVGFTPYHATGFLPGLYEITLNKEGYEIFRKTVELKEGGKEFVTGTLVREAGYVVVTSTPPNASVFINDTLVGATPFHSRPLVPGIYSLKVELTGHASYAEQLGISPDLTDTIQVSLVPLKKPNLVERLNLRKSRKIRLISFGVASASAGIIGLLLNEKTVDNLAAEGKAWDNYSVSGKTTAEYTMLYDKYLKSTRKTDRSASARNVFYTIGIITGIGFLISIPF